MKKKTPKQSKAAKPAVQLKDIKPKKDATGGATGGTRSGGSYTGGLRLSQGDTD